MRNLRQPLKIRYNNLELKVTCGNCGAVYAVRAKEIKVYRIKNAGTWYSEGTGLAYKCEHCNKLNEVRQRDYPELEEDTALYECLKKQIVYVKRKDVRSLKMKI